MFYKSLIFTLFSALCLAATSAHAGSSVWKVTTDNKGPALYIGGTVHMLQASDHPLPEQYDQAYAASDELFFETDLSAANKPEFQMKMMAALSFQNGQTLSQSLSETTREKLVQALTTRGMNIAMFDALKPSGAALTLSVVELQRMGMDPKLGVDVTYQAKALGDKKAIGTLETPEEQISFLAAMDQADPNKFMLHTLRDLERLPTMMASMRAAWREGNIAQLEHESLKEMKEEFPTVYAVLIKQRNDAWMQKIPAMLRDDNTEFVLVGTLHLAGKDGLLQQLKNLGYTVTQL